MFYRILGTVYLMISVVTISFALRNYYYVKDLDRLENGVLYSIIAFMAYYITMYSCDHSEDEETKDDEE